MICRSGGRVVWRISLVICLGIVGEQEGRWGIKNRSLTSLPQRSGYRSDVERERERSDHVGRVEV